MKEFSLPKNIILNKKADFSCIILEGETQNTQFFRAFFIRDDQFKIGFAVQKGYRNKPERNYLKRKLKELCRLSYKEHRLSGKNVIIIKKIALKTNFKILQDDFKSLLVKLENISI